MTHEEDGGHAVEAPRGPGGRPSPAATTLDCLGWVGPRSGPGSPRRAIRAVAPPGDVPDADACPPLARVGGRRGPAGQSADRQEAARPLIGSTPRRGREALVALVAGGLAAAAAAGHDERGDLPLRADGRARGPHAPASRGTTRAGREASGRGAVSRAGRGGGPQGNVEGTMGGPGVEAEVEFAFRVVVTATATLSGPGARQARDRLVLALDGAAARVTTGGGAGLELLDMRTSADVTLLLVDGADPFADLARAIERWKLGGG